MRPHFLFASLLAIALGIGPISPAAGADPATPATSPVVASSQLKPGEFVWHPQAAPQGPLLMVVSIPEQRAYLYRNGVRIAVTTVSTGKPGNETPAGVYTVLQKHKEHYSNLYDNAPMPFMQRLTWGGIALHAGRLPGYPASHGCIRLPLDFARLLFAVTELGMTVVVSDTAAATPDWVHPGWLAPSAPTLPVPPPGLEQYTWHPERSPSGPLTLLLGTSDGSLRALRNGVVIGTARLRIDGPVPPGTQVLQLQAGVEPEESRFVPGKPRLRWLQVPLDGTTPPSVDHLYRNVHVPPEFARLVYDSLVPGTTVVLTDRPTTEVETDREFLDSPPAAGENR